MTSNQFTILMRLILLNQIPGKFIHDDWLERLFYACNTSQHTKFTFLNGNEILVIVIVGYKRYCNQLIMRFIIPGYQY